MVSAESSITLNFKTFTNRGAVKGQHGVFFHGDTLRNYSDLSLINPRIKHLFNGESITGDTYDAFFASIEKQIPEKAEAVEGLEIDLRRAKISEILEKAKDINMLEDEIESLRAYLNATVRPVDEDSSCTFPMLELSRIISACNKRSVSKTAANLLAYNSSAIEILENTGHIEFIKELHKVHRYIGTTESELLMPELTEDFFANFDIPQLSSEPITEVSVPKDGIHTTAEEIAALSIDQRREAINSILEKVKNMRVLKDSSR